MKLTKSSKAGLFFTSRNWTVYAKKRKQSLLLEICKIQADTLFDETSIIDGHSYWNLKVFLDIQFLPGWVVRHMADA